MMFVKWTSFELLLLINLLLCSGCSADYVGKTKRTSYERYVEHAWSDQNSIVKNHLDQCVEVQYLFNIIDLGPALFSNDNNIGTADNKNSRINLI